jgi:diadenosine tetraphosphate (Ap4A) HIT family hydrolase
MCESNEKIRRGEDPFFIIETETGYATLRWIQRYKGYTLFISKEHLTELHELPRETKLKYLEEMSIISEALYNVFKPRKMNYELLGNHDLHMHWHLIPRYNDEERVEEPIWRLPNEELNDEKYRLSNDEARAMAAKIRAEVERLLLKH